MRFVQEKIHIRGTQIEGKPRIWKAGSWGVGGRGWETAVDGLLGRTVGLLRLRK